MKHTISLAICGLLALGCYQPKDQNLTKFQIRTSEKTNGGAPFYVVTKTTDDTQIIKDEYRKIAQEAFGQSARPEHVHTYCIIPGKKKNITVKAPDNRLAAIYVLFTHPGKSWNHYTAGNGRHKVKLLLGENEIESISEF